MAMKFFVGNIRHAFIHTNLKQVGFIFPQIKQGKKYKTD